MRSVNILMVGLLSMTALPALAQTSPSAASPSATSLSATGARPGHEPGVGTSLPLSNHASNIDSTDTKSTIAPTLPASGLGPDGTPADYLRAARAALMAGQTGQAQQSLEMAETRLLSRSVPQGQTDSLSNNPRVAEIENARHALGNGDKAGAVQMIDQALSR